MCMNTHTHTHVHIHIYLFKVFPGGPRETQVQSLGWEDLLEKGMVIHSNILAWNNSMDRESWRVGYNLWGQKGLDTTGH